MFTAAPVALSKLLLLLLPRSDVHLQRARFDPPVSTAFLLQPVDAKRGVN
jgi:hypothetical protein